MSSGTDVPTLRGDETLGSIRAGSDRLRFEPGASIGRYVVERRLGAGGMGLVVAAHDPQLEREVAIKVLLDGGMGHDAPHHRVRMQREAQALAAVSHPNVVTVLDVGEVEGQVFIAMELVEGQTLAHWLAAAPRTWRQILAVYRGAGRGLEAVHAAGLVHRDFKPTNVLVGSDGRVRVTDFGVVGIEATSPSFPPAPMPSQRDDDVSRGITRPGAIVGTPAYMAPEQASGLPPDPQSDQFSFCVALYEGLYGVAPFAGDTLAQRVAACSEHRFEPPVSGKRTPRRIRQALLRGLDPEPTQRWRSMSALLDALAPRVRVRLAIGVGVAIAAVAGIAVGAARLGEEQCAHADRDALRGTWDGAARRRLRATVLENTDAPSELWDPVEARLDDWVTRWLDARATLCEDTRTPAEIDASWLCLRAQRNAFETFTRVMGEGDRAMLLEASAAVEQLDAPAECLVLDAPASVDPEVEVEVRAAAAEATTLLSLGRLEEGTAKANAVLERARKAGLCKPEVILELALARSEARRGRFEDAVELLESTYHAATRCAPFTATVAAMEIYRLLAADLSRPEQAAVWLGHARAMAERVDEERLHAIITETEAQVALRAGEVERARTLYEDAWERFEAEAQTDPRVGARVLGGLGSVYRQLGELDAAERAQERALAFQLEAVGELHPDVAGSLNGLGNVQGDRGRLDEAAVTFERAVALWNRLAPDDVRGAFTRANLAIIRLRQRRNEEAFAGFDAAYQRLFEAYGDHPAAARVRMYRAQTLGRLARYEEAEQDGLRALETLRASPADAGWCLTLIAESELLRGRLPEARRRVEEVAEVCPSEECRGHALLVRGQIEAAEGRTQEAITTLREGERIVPASQVDYAIVLPEAVESALRGDRSTRDPSVGSSAAR